MLPDAEQLLDTLTEQIRAQLSDDSALVGIHSGGAWLAERLQKKLGGDIPLGTLDISFYRDDFNRIGLHPQVRPSDIPFDVEGRDILLIDDIVYTGRTIRAAMNELFDYGRPARIRLVALIDRGGRELPLEPQFSGARLVVPDDTDIHLNRGAQGRLSLSYHQAEPNA